MSEIERLTQAYAATVVKRAMVEVLRPAPHQKNRVPCLQSYMRRHHCKLQHHLEKVCRNKARSKANPQRTDSGECEGAVFDALCAATEIGLERGRRAIILDHHLYNNMCHMWMQQASQPQTRHLRG